ncbi:MAG: hypothetical protein QOF78_418 [Phycisphaerales bacterium]|jgi:hypothetical protein|nr:hypothetical protein [Phycisphaerales bacterium]
MIPLRRACLVVLAAIFLGAAAPATAPVASAPSGLLGKPIQLFNGKDLDGWVWYQRPPKTATAPAVVDIAAVWSVKDGLLRCKGKPTGYIRTANEYGGNYILTVEQRHLAKGNGGILFALTGADKIWPRCLEVQAQTGEEGDIRNIADFKLTMDESRVEPKRLRRLGPSSEKPPGEWETVQIIVDNGNLTITLNGQLQNIARYTESLAGRIGLQSEGGEMEFRKIEITPIETAADERAVR